MLFSLSNYPKASSTLKASSSTSSFHELSSDQATNATTDIFLKYIFLRGTEEMKRSFNAPNDSALFGEAIAVRLIKSLVLAVFTPYTTDNQLSDIDSANSDHRIGLSTQSMDLPAAITQQTVSNITKVTSAMINTSNQLLSQGSYKIGGGTFLQSIYSVLLAEQIALTNLYNYHSSYTSNSAELPSSSSSSGTGMVSAMKKMLFGKPTQESLYQFLHR